MVLKGPARVALRRAQGDSAKKIVNARSCLGMRAWSDKAIASRLAWAYDWKSSHPDKYLQTKLKGITCDCFVAPKAHLSLLAPRKDRVVMRTLRRAQGDIRRFFIKVLLGAMQC